MIDFDSIPVVDASDRKQFGTARPDRAARRVRREWSNPGYTRRYVLKTTAAVSASVALASISTLAIRPRTAAAHHTTYDTHPTCNGNNHWDPIGGAGGGCCDCGSMVNSQYCSNNNYHRHDYWTTYKYQIRFTSCDDKNAWIWNWQGDDWRCSDGEAQFLVGGSWTGWMRTVCPYNLG